MSAVEQLVTNHLDLWSSAIKRRSGAGRGSSKKIELYGIKKLRELILELAIRGLLVTQNPNDEPASELLSKITAEKNKLVKDGKIKKGKPLPPIGNEEIPFQLPKGWTWVRNAYLFSLRKGKVPKDISENGSIPYLDIEALDRGNIRRYTNDTKIPLATTKDLLVVCDGSRSGLVLDGMDGAIGSTLAVIDTLPFISPFIKLIFRHGYERLNSSLKGAAIPHLDTKKLLTEISGLPSLEEQFRIVSKVDELMALCDRLEQQTETSISAHQALVEMLLDSLIQSVAHAEPLGACPGKTAFENSWERIATHFETLFTTENSIEQLKEAILFMAVNGMIVGFPPNSKKGKLSEFLSFGPRNGFSPKESPIETGQQVLKLGATSYGFLDLSQAKFFDDDIPESSHLWLKAGDILLQRGNSHIFVGSNVLVESDNNKVIYPDLMMKLRVVTDASPKYVSMWLSAPPAREHMWKRMTGTSGTMPKISKGVVEDISITLPPMDIQEQTVSQVMKLVELCDKLKDRLSVAQTTQLHLADAITEQALKRSS